MATIFKRYQDRVDKEIEEQSGGGGKPKAPEPPAAPKVDFFKAGPPIDPEVRAARDKARLKLLRQ